MDCIKTTVHQVQGPFLADWSMNFDKYPVSLPKNKDCENEKSSTLHLPKRMNTGQRNNGGNVMFSNESVLQQFFFVCQYYIKRSLRKRYQKYTI